MTDGRLMTKRGLPGSSGGQASRDATEDTAGHQADPESVD